MHTRELIYIKWNLNGSLRVENFYNMAKLIIRAYLLSRVLCTWRVCAQSLRTAMVPSYSFVRAAWKPHETPVKSSGRCAVFRELPEMNKSSSRRGRDAASRKWICGRMIIFRLHFYFSKSKANFPCHVRYPDNFSVHWRWLRQNALATVYEQGVVKSVDA